MSYLLKISIFCFFIFFPALIFSQEKSKIIKINDRDYYVHQVSKGESLYGISKTYGVDVETILNENIEVKEKGLRAGQKILIPVHLVKNSATTKDNRDTVHFKYHKVLKGQTVYSICKTYLISQDEFYEFNPDKTSGIKEDEWVIVGKKTVTPNKNEVPISAIQNGIVEKNNLISLQIEKKNRYKVLLLLPFSSDKARELVVEDWVKTDQNFPVMSSMMIDFYKGLDYAIDSLKTDSFNIQLMPIDIKETDSLKILKLITTEEYKNSDVIIGPVYSSLIKSEQQFSKEKKFHIVPFIGYNKFLFNHPEYSKTTPSVYSDIQVLTNYVFDSLRKKTEVVLLYSSANGEKEYAKEFKRFYNDWIIKNNFKDTIRTFKSIADFKKTVQEKQNYTVVLLTNNQVIATDYITQLSIINKTSPIYLCGFFKTTTFDNLDLEYLNQMNFVFANYQNIQYDNLFSKYSKKYQDEFYTEPSTFFYEGMQIGLYYFHLIKKYGLAVLYELNNHVYNENDSFIRFKFYHPDESTGLQNNGEYLFKIQDRKAVLVR